MRAAVVLLGLIGCAGCKSAVAPTGFGVDLVIDARELSTRAQATQLRVTTSGAESDSTTLSTTVLAEGGVARTVYRPAVQTGSLVFTVAALDSGSSVLGTAMGTVTLVAGEAVDLTLDITGEEDDGGASDAEVAPDLTPAQCVNKVLDTGETDVDCGGVCPACEPDKQCLVAKDCATMTCVSNICELASGPPSWVPVTMLPSGYVDLLGGAASLDDGVYLVAGENQSTYLGATYRYDGTLDAWCGMCGDATVPGPLVEARQGLAVVAAGKQLLAIGGLGNIAAPTDLASIELFDDMTQTWSTAKRTLSVARENIGCAVAKDGLVYCVGGSTVAGAVLGTLDSFDPTADGVGPATTRPSLTVARAYAGVSADALGRVLAVGGDAMTTGAIAEVELYDTGTKAWTTGPALSVARSGPGAALGADGRVYAVGGNGNDAAGTSLGTGEALATNADHWTPVASLTPRTALMLAQGPDGRLYAIGGRTVNSAGLASGLVEAYGPTISPGPATDPAGSSIAINLSNFAANANVTVTFNGDAPGTIAVHGVSDANGDVKPSLVWKVPSVAPGTYVLTAVDDHARYPVRATFVVE